MRQIQTLFAALLSVMILIFAGMENSYAQSQYRRQSNSGRKSNSEYRPAQNKPAQQVAPPAQNRQPQQQARPSQQARPQQQTRPQQAKPSQNVRPSQSTRPAQNTKPAQNARPSQSARPAQNQKPSNVNRPAANNRPGNVAPPAGHFRPKYNHRGVAEHLRPRPSVHFYGYYTNLLPVGAKIIHRGAYDYYYVSGRYYRYINNVYVISRPPVGAVIAKSILNGLLRLTDYVIRDAYGRTQRYYTDDDGVYYVKSGSNYIVVDPPVGAIVYELPYGFEEVTINGAKYYKVDDNFYELVYNGPQDYYFRVVGTLGR